MLPLAAAVNIVSAAFMLAFVLRIIAANITIFVARERFGPVLGTAYDYLHDATEPFLAPLRRVLPDLGRGLDLSPMVAVVIVYLLGHFLSYALLRGS